MQSVNIVWTEHRVQAIEYNSLMGIISLSTDIQFESQNTAISRLYFTHESSDFMTLFKFMLLTYFLGTIMKLLNQVYP